MPFASVAPIESPARVEPCLAEFITCREAIPTHARVVDIAQRFRQEPELEAVGVVDSHGVPVGFLDRTKLLFKLSLQYGHALYSRAEVTKVLDGEPRLLPAQTPLSNALSTVLGNEDANLSEAIVVVDDDQNFLGIVPVRRLIMLQANALTNATLEWQIVDRKARELERVAELKSRFLAHVTHELRAPVNAMIGLVGEGLAQVLGRNERIAGIPILFYSSNDADSLRHAARRHGVAGFVCKGDAEELFRKVREHAR